ncbi:hypothetical protein GCM10027425_02930 [Alteromonas gracilis]
MIEAWVSAPLVLAGVLVVAALTKWRVRGSLESAAVELRVPADLLPAVRRLPELELALAVGLVAAPWPVLAGPAAVGALLLMLAYTGVVARGLTLRPRPVCGCFGTVGSPIGVRTLLRNLLLVAIAAVAVVATLDGRTVPATLLGASPGTVGWLAALAVTALLVGWIVADRAPGPGLADLGGEAEDAEALDYVRRPIPPLMLASDEGPVALAALARERAQLLVWVACGCARSHEAVALVQDWRRRMPGIDVRLVSTLEPESTVATFGEQERWLHDPRGQALALLGVRADPVGLLLGADGLLAGGPVEGLDGLDDFGEQIAEQLSV